MAGYDSRLQRTSGNKRLQGNRVPDFFIDQLTHDIRVACDQLILAKGGYDGSKMVKTFTELQATLAANRHYRARIRRDIGGSSGGREYEIWIENVASGKVISNIGTSVNPFRQ